MIYNKLKNRKTLITIAAAIMLMGVPFFIFNNLEKAFNTGLSIVSTSAAIATFIIAILLYDKFGANRLIKEKQITTVLNLLNILKTTAISAKAVEINMLIWISKDLKVYEKFENLKPGDHDKIYDFRKKQVLYSSMQSGYINEKIDEIVKSIYMPKPLKDEFTFLRVTPMMVIHGSQIKTKEDEYIIIYSGGEFSLDSVVVGYPPSGSMNFEEFLKKLEQLVIKIEDWISSHTDLKGELNLDTN